MHDIRRYHAEGVWQADSALHLGGESSELDHDVDMALLRGSDEAYRIPGSSIAGVCRSYLARRMMGSLYFNKGALPPKLLRMFGGDYESLLTVFDATVVKIGNSDPSPSRRDCVRLDGKTRTAASNAKFDLDVLPAGTKFKLRFQLRVREVDCDLEPELLRMLRAILEAFQVGEIRVGARTRKGLGRGRVSRWQISRLDMADRQHMQAFLRQAWLKGAEIQGPEALVGPPLEDKRRLFTMEADLSVKTSMLIRSSGVAPRSPDMVHFTEGGAALLSGSALSGAIRHRVERIANTVLAPDGARAAVVRLFGPLHEKKGRGVDLHSGRVTVEESPLTRGSHLVQGRVALDRAFQSPIPGALFDEAAWWPSDEDVVNWHLTVQSDLTLYVNPEEEKSDVRLLAHALRDLLLGDLTVGGEAGVGRGVSVGVSVTMSHPDAGTLSFDQNGTGIQRTAGDPEKWMTLLNG
jgi:CRISPR/Cas system CSM-associated protein Csm3 (group 7 of RAMP superfamily)